MDSRLILAFAAGWVGALIWRQLAIWFRQSEAAERKNAAAIDQRVGSEEERKWMALSDEEQNAQLEAIEAEMQVARADLLAKLGSRPVETLSKQEKEILELLRTSAANAARSETAAA